MYVQIVIFELLQKLANLWTADIDGRNIFWPIKKKCYVVKISIDYIRSTVFWYHILLIQNFPPFCWVFLKFNIPKLALLLIYNQKEQWYFE